MSTTLAVVVQISCFLVQNAASQFNYPQPFPFQNPAPMPEHYYPPPPPPPPPGMMGYQFSQSQVTYVDYEDDSMDCRCSCETCITEPKNCCQSICESCGYPPNQEVVLVPYPYPLVISLYSNKQSDPTTTKPKKKTTTKPKTTTASTKKTTTTTTTPTTRTTTLITTTISDKSRLRQNNEHKIEDPSDYRRDNLLNEVILESPKTMSRKNYLPSRRVEEDLQQYGIVAIPDEMAMNLMAQLSQLRRVKPIRNIPENDKYNSIQYQRERAINDALRYYKHNENID